MPVKPFIPVLLAVLLAALLSPAVVAADVLVFCLDTSGSMKKHGKFDAAKQVLTQHIRDAQPGNVIYAIAFDSNEYPLGRLDVGEDGSPEAKDAFIAKIRGLKARGLYTNLDEPLQAAKAFLLEERAPGTRKIIILSDGLSDPSPDHMKVDLKGIADMIPQALGWSLYVVGLPEDIAGLFQVSPPDSGVVLAPENQHIKGIALEHFTRETIAAALTVAKHDAPAPVLPPTPPAPPPAVQETPPPPPPVQDVPGLSGVAEANPATPEAPRARSALPLLWVLGALLLAAVGACLLVPRRAAGKPRASFVLEVQEETRDAKRVPLVLGEDEQKTIGPRGDIALLHSPELPAVVGTLRWSKEQLWLTPQDTLTVNGRLITTKTPVGPGDRLKVRENVHVLIDEGEETT